MKVKKNKQEKIFLINQVTGPLFIDIANSYINKYEDVTLVTGSIGTTYAELNTDINIIYKSRYIRDKGYLRILTWFLFFIQVYFLILFKSNITRIIFVSNPPILPFLGSMLSFKKFKYDVLVYDVYPDVLSNFGYIKKDSFIFRFWDRMNLKTYKNADRIFTISDVMKKIISRTTNKSKIEVVYPWVDTSFIRPILKSKNWFIDKHKLKGKRVILYSGNMGVTHDFMTILNSAVKLNNIDSDFHFLFIGDGVQKNDLVRFATKHELKNITFLPYQEASVLPYSFTSADFGVVTLGTGAEGLSVPSKTFYQLAAGLCIIAISEKGSEIENLVNSNNCGISINPGDTVTLYKFIQSITDDELDLYKENSRLLSTKFTVKNSELFI